jgi:hypothetical protein
MAAFAIVVWPCGMLCFERFRRPRDYLRHIPVFLLKFDAQILHEELHIFPDLLLGGRIA